MNEDKFEDAVEEDAEEEQKVDSSFKEREPMHHLDSSPKNKKSYGLNKLSGLNLWKVSTIVLLLAVVFLYFGNNSGSGSDIDTVTQGTMNFINTNLLQGQAVAILKESAEEAGVYKMTVEINGQELNGYVSKDGKLFFPQVIDTTIDLSAASASTPSADIVKSDKPVVELFVMSHCPYGTQAEKGILPAVELLSDQIDFSIKFVNYAMHGKKELDEEAKQVCLMDDAKYFDYLECFLDKGDDGAADCLTQAGFDAVKVASCVNSLDQQYDITAGFNDQSTWLSGSYPVFKVHNDLVEQYGVQGSPTLVINGQKVDSGRSPAEYLNTICAAFNEEPTECEQVLSTTSFSAGFGYEGTGTSTEASCGN